MSLEGFLTEVKQMFAIVQQTQALLTPLANAYLEQRNAYTPSGTELAQQHQEQILNEIHGNITQVRSWLAARSRENQAGYLIGKDKEEITLDATDLETRRNQVQRVYHLMQSTSTSVEDTIKKAKGGYQSAISSAYKLAHPEATESEINQMVAVTEPGDNIFSGVSAHVRLSEIQERHRKIVQLEQKLLHLHELFMDFAVLVDSASTSIQHIEINVDETMVSTMKAAKDVSEAKKLQRTARRRKFCTALGCMVIVGIIVLLVVLLI